MEQNQKKEGRTGHLSQFGVINEVGSVSVDESAQSQAVLPTESRQEGGKVGEVDQSAMVRRKKMGKGEVTGRLNYNRKIWKREDKTHGRT